MELSKFLATRSVRVIIPYSLFLRSELDSGLIFRMTEIFMSVIYTRNIEVTKPQDWTLGLCTDITNSG